MTNTQTDNRFSWLWERPARAFKIFFKGSRSEAIKEMCVGCVGSSQEAKLCVCTDCPLWIFRPGATKGELPSWVPSESDLEALVESKVSPAVRENARQMGLSRKGNTDAN